MWSFCEETDKALSKHRCTLIIWALWGLGLSVICLGESWAGPSAAGGHLLAAGLQHRTGQVSELRAAGTTHTHTQRRARYGSPEGQKRTCWFISNSDPNSFLSCVCDWRQIILIRLLFHLWKKRNVRRKICFPRVELREVIFLLKTKKLFHLTEKRFSSCRFFFPLGSTQRNTGERHLYTLFLFYLKKIKL